MVLLTVICFGLAIPKLAVPLGISLAFTIVLLFWTVWMTDEA